MRPAGLPSQFHLDLPTSGEAADEPLGMVLVDRGYRVVTPTVVMTGACGDIDPLRDGASPVHVSASLSNRSGWRPTRSSAPRCPA